MSHSFKFMLDALLKKLHLTKQPDIAKVYPKGYFEVESWILSDFVLEKLVPVVGVRPFPLTELCLMSSTLCWLKPSHAFDWGTHIGKSARIFHETSVHFNLHTKIHSIDLPDDIEHVEHPHSSRGKLVRNFPDVTLNQGDGLTVALSIIKKEHIQSALFFCDGDHSFQSVTRELNGIHKNSSKHAILVHDTFNQVHKSKYNIGPYKAISTFLAKHPKSYDVISTGLGLPGMTLLLPKKV